MCYIKQDNHFIFPKCGRKKCKEIYGYNKGGFNR